METQITSAKRTFFKSWQEASEVAIAGNIHSQKEYAQRYKTLNVQLHHNPPEFYSDFPCWEIFLGKKYKTWQEASTVAKQWNIKSSEEYFKLYRNKRQDKKMAFHPETFYSDFPGWGVFLGFEPIPKNWINTNDLIIQYGGNMQNVLSKLKSSNVELFKYFWVSNKAQECIIKRFVPGVVNDFEILDKESKVYTLLRKLLVEAQDKNPFKAGPYDWRMRWRGFDYAFQEHKSEAMDFLYKEEPLKESVEEHVRIFFTDFKEGIKKIPKESEYLVKDIYDSLFDKRYYFRY